MDISENRVPAERTWVLGCIALITVAALWSYWGIHLNHFYFDDIQNILLTTALHWSELSWEGIRGVIDGGYLKDRPISNLSFAFSWWAVWCDNGSS